MSHKHFQPFLDIPKTLRRGPSAAELLIEENSGYFLVRDKSRRIQMQMMITLARSYSMQSLTML